MTLDDCLDGGRFREETANRRVVTIHQGRCRAASTGLEADQRRSARLRFLRQTDFDLCTRSHGLCDVLKNACLDQCGFGHIGNRIPLELTHGQTVAVGCQKRDVIAVDFDADGGKKRKGFIARSCDRYLSNGLLKNLRIYRTCNLRLCGKKRVFVNRHDCQGEV